MKKIGLIGGMSWESTQVYYRAFNEGVKKRLGGFHSAEVMISSVDFAEVEACQRADDWKTAGDILVRHAVELERGGSKCILIGANTMHLVYEAVCEAVAVPVIHIGDASGLYAVDKGYKKLGLLGTKFTMEMDFYRKRIHEKFGLEVVIPDEADRNIIHDVIYQELCMGTFKDTSRAEYQKVIMSLASQGCEAVLLGCTEIGLLMGDEPGAIPMLDTAILHADTALDFALGD